MIWSTYRLLRHNPVIRDLLARIPFRYQKKIIHLVIRVSGILNVRRVKQLVFILGTRRSGTYLLMDHLQSFGNFGGEVLNSGLPQGIGIDPSVANPKQAIRHMRACIRALTGSIGGFKLLLEHLSQYGLSALDVFAQNPGSKIILIYRRDLLAQFISYKTAEHTGQWVKRDNTNTWNEELCIDPDEFNRFVAEIRELYASVVDDHAMFSRTLVVQYEELIADPNMQIERIAGFLDIPVPRQQKVLVNKFSKGRIEDAIANMDQLQELIEADPTLRRFNPFANENRPTERVPVNLPL